MTDPVVLAAVRSPIGALHGALAELHPVELLCAVLDACVSRGGVSPAEVAEVVVGCVEQVGGQSGNVARAAVLAAGWPVTVGGTTVDRGAVSGIAALGMADALVRAGVSRVVLAASVDAPSTVPLGAAAMGRHPFGRPWQGVADRHELVPPGLAAERVVRARSIPRQAQDEWAAASVRRALAARADGELAEEIVAVGTLETDELLDRRSADERELAGIPPRFDVDGTITAGNSAPPADGAVAVLIADAAWARAQGLAPIASLRSVRLAAGEQDDLVAVAVDAARAATDIAGVDLTAMTAVEIHEATAAVTLATADELGVDPAVVNPHGGAIAVGDLTAGSGLRGVVRATHRLVRHGGPGTLVVCSGIGLGAAAVVAQP